MNERDHDAPVQRSQRLPDVRPEPIDLGVALALRGNPPRAGQWASDIRERYFGKRTILRPTPACSPDHPAYQRSATVLRRGEPVGCEAWPAPAAWQPGDRVAVVVEPGDELVSRRYVEWLLQLREHFSQHRFESDPWLGPCSLAPWSRNAGGTARLWAIAVARLILPDSLRVEARHDRIGIRLAQVALGFGADTLAGPLEVERKLPVAGVTRPTEATLTGLRYLIEQAGFEPALLEDSAERARESGRYTIPIDLDAIDPADSTLGQPALVDDDTHAEP